MMNMNLKNKETDMLVLSLLSLKTKEECYAFLEDVLTIKELSSISQRLEVARLLKEKKTFSEIISKTGASSATVSRVNKCLMYGSGGYDVVLNKIL